MWEDPIVKETHEARERLFARFDYDLAALCRFLRQKEAEHPDRFVTLKPRPDVARKGANGCWNPDGPDRRRR